jgi:uncharacterized protein YkwD
MKISIVFIIGLAIIIPLVLHYTVSFEKKTNTSLEVTTTTIITTTTTQPAPVELSMGEQDAGIVTDERVQWLEQRTFDLVNNERMKAGLEKLKWNEDVADVCRIHSMDMAENQFFSHTGTGNTTTGDRLKDSGLYYWNLSGENILMGGGIDYYSVSILGVIRDVEYKTLEELAQEAVQGWMNSTGHRENILEAGFDESAIGVYALENILGGSSYLNVSYYFTQDFITRIDCGYVGANCCSTPGYLPWCYLPWECVSGICE